MINQHILLKETNTTTSKITIDRLWKVMKFASLLCMCLGLLFGCGEADLDETDPIANNLPDLDDLKVREQILMEAIDENDLQTRTSPSGEELFYAPNQQKSYTGWVKEVTYDDETPYALWQVQDGKKHGLYLWWYSNQQNREKGSYEEGFKYGTWTYWDYDGQKKKEGEFKDGTEYGEWIFWINGQKYSGLIHDDVEEIVFSPDGRTLASVTGRGGRYGDYIIIRLWDVGSWKRKATIAESIRYTSWYNDIAFSPDGQILALAAREKNLYLGRNSKCR